MRLQEVYFICKSALEELPKYSTTESAIPGSNAKRHTIVEWEKIDEILIELYRVSGMQNSIDKFRSTSKMLSPGSKDTYLTASENDSALAAYSRLKSSLSAVVETYAGFEIPEHTDGIDIKLPDNTTLEQLSEIAKGIDRAFKQYPAFNFEGDSIALVAMDVGSMWLSFSVAGSFILNRIAAFVDKCIAMKSHFLLCKSQEEHAKACSMGNEYIENMMDMHKKFTATVARSLADALCSENGITANEEIERARHAVETFGELMSQGVEVYSAINAPMDVKAIFPSAEKQSIPQKFVGILHEQKKLVEEPKE